MTPAQQEVVDYLAGFCVGTLNLPSRPGAEVPFEDVGMDSLDLIELAMEAESAFGVKIPNEKLSGLETLAQLAAVVRPT